MFTDKLSGSANTARPGLVALLDYARPPDTVVVTAIDRLGRSLAKVTRTIVHGTYSPRIAVSAPCDLRGAVLTRIVIPYPPSVVDGAHVPRRRHPRAAALTRLAGVPKSSRARPRRTCPVTYQVRVDLDGAKPPIWRRLLLSSELMLDELHAVLQQAMGWTDSHLHQFLAGENKMDPLAVQYHMQFMLDEGAEGVLENRVRLDELLTGPKGRLFYWYDFGDDWEHTLVVENVLPRSGEEPSAICIGGARACPPEDCGGIWGYHELLVDQVILDDGEFEFDPTYFSVEETNECLRDLLDQTHDGGWVPDPATGDHDRHVEAAASAVGWLLNRVGEHGIRLTAAGYLPPKVVTAAMDELGWRAKWIGSCTREDTTAPILELRQTAQQLKLLRKYRGQLLLTKIGAALRHDPEALRRHLAQSLPLTSLWWTYATTAPPSGPAPITHPAVVDLDERRRRRTI